MSVERRPVERGVAADVPVVDERRRTFVGARGVGAILVGWEKEGEQVLDDVEAAVGGRPVEEAGLGAEPVLVDVDGGGEDGGRGG